MYLRVNNCRFISLGAFSPMFNSRNLCCNYLSCKISYKNEVYSIDIEKH